MQLMHPNHPIWNLGRLLIVAATLAFVFWCGLVYKNPIELKDLIPIVSTLTALGGYDVLKRRVTHASPDDVGEPSQQ